MSKLEYINYALIKNTKLEKSTLKHICNCFIEDFTASQTANEVNLSRQTINSYYKLIRNYLIYDKRVSEYIITLKKESITLNYTLINSNIIYYLEHKGKIYILNEEFPIYKRINEEIKSSLVKHKKANCAKLLFNSYEKKYFISSFLKRSDSFEIYLSNRLKKFRGINKENFYTHIQETLIRYNYDKNYLRKKLNSLLFSN